MRLVLGLVALLISSKVYATGANPCDNPGAALNNPNCQEQPPPPPPPPPPEYPPEVPPETNPISELISKTLEELLQIKVQEKVEEVLVEQPKKLNLVLPETEILNIITTIQPIQQTTETAPIVRLEPRLELVTQTLSQSSLSVADQEAAGVLPVIKDSPRPVATKTSSAQSGSNSYMEANQGVILDAMSTTDVSSYKTANIPDLAVWYKSVEVYKNNKLDDNKRSYYFMNKGSTDTYKQMIEDQYR